MSSDRRSTTAKGLGWAHQRARAAALAALVPGTPCPYCRRPMLPGQALDLDHLIPRSRGGAGGPVRLAHASCNRRAGQQLSSARSRAKRQQDPPRSRRW
jgi:5-methylcytosine-specific restriction endonuclease McrA